MRTTKNMLAVYAHDLDIRTLTHFSPVSHFYNP